MKEPKPLSGKRGGCCAAAPLLGVMLCSFMSSASEPIQHAAFVPEITAALQRLEGIKVVRPDGCIGLVKEIVLARPNPRAGHIRPHNPQASVGVAIGHALAQYLALGIGELGCLRIGNALGMAVATDSEKMGDEPAKEKEKQPPKSVWRNINHAAWLIICIGGGYGFILCLRDWWRAVTPNDQAQRPPPETPGRLQLSLPNYPNRPTAQRGGG